MTRIDSRIRNSGLQSCRSRSKILHHIFTPSEIPNSAFSEKCGIGNFIIIYCNSVIVSMQSAALGTEISLYRHLVIGSPKIGTCLIRPLTGRSGRLRVVGADHSFNDGSNQYQSIRLNHIDRMILESLVGHTQSRCNGPQRCKLLPPNTVSHRTTSRFECDESGRDSNSAMRCWRHVRRNFTAQESLDRPQHNGDHLLPSRARSDPNN